MLSFSSIPIQQFFCSPGRLVRFVMAKLSPKNSHGWCNFEGLESLQGVEGSFCILPQEGWNLEITPVQKESHLTKLGCLGSMFVFGGVYTLCSKASLFALGQIWPYIFMPCFFVTDKLTPIDFFWGGKGVYIYCLQHIRICKQYIYVCTHLFG